VPVVRSIVAVAAGFFAVMVLSAAADVFFKSAPLGARMAYEAAFAFAAGYVTARIAIRKPFTHVMAMAVLVLAGRAFIAVASWDVFPLWFNVGVLALIIPVALLGAKLGLLRSGQ
jgi:hypothetical protein